MRCRRRLRRCFPATAGFQALSAQAAAFHAQFVQALNAGAGSYAAAEAANASPLQAVGAGGAQEPGSVINAPVQDLTGRPLIGNGANGAPGTGQNGGARRVAVGQRRRRRLRRARHRPGRR